MGMSRRTMVQGLGAGILGAGLLSACGTGGIRRGRGRRPTTTAPTGDALSEPDTPLVIGSIGASYGRSAPFEKAIALAVHEAWIDVNAEWKGLFGHDVGLVDRHVVTEPGADLTEVIEGLAEAGVTACITSVDEETLVAAIPAFVAAGIAVIDVFSSGMSVRAPEVETSGMLARLCPNDKALAAYYAEQSWAVSGDRAGAPGTVAYVSEDSAQGRSLLFELTQVLGPTGGKVVLEHFHAAGDLGDVNALVASVLETRPALLIVNGGPETGPFLSALHTATLEGGQRPTVEIAAQLSPAASVNYAEADLAAECLSRAKGLEPGGEYSVRHVNMMLNVDPGLYDTGYAYSQQAYDGFVIAALAAQDALSVEGTAIAASIPRVLTGSGECNNYGECRTVLRDALAAGAKESITYVGRSGPLELGSDRDPRVGDLRHYSWNDANELEFDGADGYELEG